MHVWRTLAVLLAVWPIALPASGAIISDCSSLGAGWFEAVAYTSSSGYSDWSGASTTSLNARNWYRGGPDITLSKSGLPTHSRLHIEMEWGPYTSNPSDGWEGATSDYVDISQSGTRLLRASFATSRNGGFQSYDGACGPDCGTGSGSSGGTGAVLTDFISSHNADLYEFVFSDFAHTSGTLTLTLDGTMSNTGAENQLVGDVRVCAYDICFGVTCDEPTNPDICRAQSGTCSSGSCAYAPLVSGEACLDNGIACDGAETCSSSGACVSPTTCSPSTDGDGSGGSVDDGGDNGSGDDDDDNGGFLAVLIGGIAGVAAVVWLVGVAIVRRSTSSDDAASSEKTLLGGSPTRQPSPAKQSSHSPQKQRRPSKGRAGGGRGGLGGAPRGRSGSNPGPKGGRSQSLTRAGTGAANNRGRSRSQGRAGAAKPVRRATTQTSKATRTDFITSLDFLANDGRVSIAADDTLSKADLETKEGARRLFTKLLTRKDLHMVVALIDATPVSWAEVTCRTIVAAFVSNHQVVYLLRSLVTREIAYAENPPDAFKATSRAAKCFTAFAKVAGGAFLRDALGKPLEASITGGLTLEPSNTAGLTKASAAFFGSITSASKSIPQEFQRVLNVLFASAKEKWSEAKARELLAGFLFVRLLCPSIAYPSGSGLADKDLVTPKIQSSLILVSKVMQKLAMGVKFSVKDGDLQQMNSWLDKNFDGMDKFMTGLARANAKQRQTMMELPKWGEESEVSRYSIMSSASALTSMSYLGAAADGIVVPQDIDALVGQALANEENFMEVLETGRDAAPEDLVKKVRQLLTSFKELNAQALAESGL